MPPTTLIDVLPLRIPDTTIFIFNDKAGGCTSHSISFELEILHISRCHRRIMAAPKIILNETMLSYPSQKFHSHPPWTRQLVGVPMEFQGLSLHGPFRQLPSIRQFLVSPEPCHLQSLRRRTWMSPSDVDWAYQTFHRVESDIVIYRAIVNQRKLAKHGKNIYSTIFFCDVYDHKGSFDRQNHVYRGRMQPYGNGYYIWVSIISTREAEGELLLSSTQHRNMEEMAIGWSSARTKYSSPRARKVNSYSMIQISYT